MSTEEKTQEPSLKKRKAGGAGAASSGASSTVTLPKNSNQARGIAQFALDFMAGKFAGPDESVLKRVELFHTDSVVCGLSALALRTNAPTILRDEALEYKRKATTGATVFGSSAHVAPEKAICANASAVREWDSNGTVFGYNKELGHIAGEFGHNDFYPVVIAACQMKGLGGDVATRAMVLLDEIRGRLCEVFSLKTYKIDHVVHGAIASAATFGALMGATVDQIEAAIGMCVAHYVPWRAIRAGHQLSDSKGASAALSTEVAIMSMLRAMRGFVGPKDIFRNPESLFRRFEPTKGDESPFNLVLTHSGSDFAVMGMHFKMGLYEHQSAGALQAVNNLLRQNPHLAQQGEIKKLVIRCYEPAFGIIGDPAKRDPHTRQSADHSMVYIVGSTLRKAIHAGKDAIAKASSDDLWKSLMLLPEDYGKEALVQPTTREIMKLIEFEHGGKEYDDNYPDGIPTSIVVTDSKGQTFDSGLVMYPAGHARNTTADLQGILDAKFKHLGALAVGEKQVKALLSKLNNLPAKSAAEIGRLYTHKITLSAQPID